MNEVLTYLTDRMEEFDRHLLIARMLEARINELVEGDAIRVEVRHINTLKSGLLIHLYNIVEAVITLTLETVGRTVVSEKPGRWTEGVLNEWVRSQIWSGEEKIGDGALKRLTGFSSILASGQNVDPFDVKGVPGSWTDESIKTIAKRLGCALEMPPEVKRAAYEKVYKDESTAMAYLAERRNAIAHGKTTFEDGAKDQTLDDLQKLAGRVLPYLRAVSESYQSYLDNKSYLAPPLGAVT